MTDEELYTVDATHTDPTQTKTALALAEKKLARAEKELAKHQWVSVEDRLPETASYLIFRYASSGNTFFGFYRPSSKQWIVNIDLNGQRAISDNDWPTHWMPIIKLEDVLMPDKGGD